MTKNGTQEPNTHQAQQGFTRLLFVWRSSLYKLILPQLLIFLLCFGFLSLLYRVAFTAQQQKDFERIVHYFETYLNMIPLSFILGFYVSTVYNRWWTQYLTLPSYDRLMLTMNLYMPSSDVETRLTRRTLLRHANLMYVLLLRQLSPAIRKRFKSLESLVDRGYMTREELDYLETGKPDYWIPSTWFINLLTEATATKQVTDSRGVSLILAEMLKIRENCSTLWNYGWVSIPLVYTQVVAIVTYSYFFACVFGRQRVGDESLKNDLPVDIFFPLFTVLQFLFYVGLLKVAEQLLNPYGEDDNDFNLNYLIDRNNRVSYVGTETLCGAPLPLENIMPTDMILAKAEERSLDHGKSKHIPTENIKGLLLMPHQLT